MGPGRAGVRDGARGAFAQKNGRSRRRIARHAWHLQELRAGARLRSRRSDTERGRCAGIVGRERRRQDYLDERVVRRLCGRRGPYRDCRPAGAYPQFRRCAGAGHRHGASAFPSRAAPQRPGEPDGGSAGSAISARSRRLIRKAGRDRPPVPLESRPRHAGGRSHNRRAAAFGNHQGADAVRAMVQQGMGVILISHKLHEVRAVTNRIMVMRLGRRVAERANDATASEKLLAELMCGREILPTVKPPSARGRALMRLTGIETTGSERRRLKNLSLDIHAGEITGIAGVAGNGQRELADVIAGVLTPLKGGIEFDGRAIDRLDPRRAQALGIGRIPEDRIGMGLLIQSPLADSMALPRIRQAPFSRHGLLDRRAIREFAEAEIEKYAIRAAGPMVRTGTLSGGNLQKALLARELAWDPLVVLAAQPTRGLDVGATQFVHGKFLELRSTGRGLVVISEDLEELYQLADRIVVMSAGRIVGDFAIGEASVEKIGLLMTGGFGGTAESA